MADEFSGAFQITKDMLYLQLPDGRRFSVELTKDGVSVNDISWNRHFMGDSKLMTRDAILAIEHSTIKCEDGANKALFDFIDNAPVPYPGKKETS
jgi:hypothetical protein